MLYTELIDEIVERVSTLKEATDMPYPCTFKEALDRFMVDLETDVLISYTNKPHVMTEEALADAAFDKKLDEEAVYKSSWVE